MSNSMFAFLNILYNCAICHSRRY